MWRRVIAAAARTSTRAVARPVPLPLHSLVVRHMGRGRIPRRKESPYTQPTVVAPYPENSKEARAAREAAHAAANPAPLHAAHTQPRAATRAADADDADAPRPNESADMARTRREEAADPTIPVGGVVVSVLPHPTCHVTLVGSLDHRGTASSDGIVAQIRSTRPAAVMVELPQGRLKDLAGWVRRYQRLRTRGDFRGRLDAAEAVDAALSIGSEVVCGDLPEPMQYTRLVYNFGFFDLWWSFYEARQWKTTLKGLQYRFGKAYGAERGRRVVNKLSQEPVPDAHVTAHYYKCLNRMHITDRDIYLTYSLHKLALRHKSVVVLVGDAHVPGITALWTRYGLDKPVTAIPVATAADAAEMKPILIAAAPPAPGTDGPLDVTGPTTFVVDFQPQPGLHMGLARAARALLLPENNALGPMWKRRVVNYLKRHPPHPNSDYLVKRLETYKWRPDAPAAAAGAAK